MAVWGTGSSLVAAEAGDGKAVLWKKELLIFIGVVRRALGFACDFNMLKRHRES